LITRTIFGEEYRSLGFSLCSFLHSHVTSSILGQNIVLSRARKGNDDDDDKDDDDDNDDDNNNNNCFCEPKGNIFNAFFI